VLYGNYVQTSQGLQSGPMKFSLVIPAYNEEGNIGKLVEEAFSVIPALMLGELIVVDDCSSDKTADEVIALKKKQKKLRLIRHQANAGQSASLRTGILAAKFDVIAQLDGDGQNDPADFEAMVKLLGKPGSNGPALVGGVRTKRKDTGSKRWASKAANAIRDMILKDDCPDTGCGTKIYWREAFIRLPFFTSIHRYLPALFQTYGYKCVYHPVNDRPRMAGVSKYNNLGRAILGIRDLFGIRWLRKRTNVPGIDEL